MGDYKWQTSSVPRFAKEKIAAIIAACGTGKTLVGIKLAIAKMLPVIVIAPKNNTMQWAEAIRELVGENEKIWVYDAVTDHKDPEKYRERFAEWLKPEPNEIENMKRRMK